jgi:hypothetical protein
VPIIKNCDKGFNKNLNPKTLKSNEVLRFQPVLMACSLFELHNVVELKRVFDHSFEGKREPKANNQTRACVS